MADNAASRHVQDSRASPDHPGSRRIVLAPQIPNGHSNRNPWANQAPKFDAQSQTIAAGVEFTFHVDYDVDFWMVAVVTAPNLSCRVVAAPSAAGMGLLLGGGGSAKLPGTGPDLSVRNTGANPLTFVAVATVGYPLQLDYDPGDLA